MDTNKMNKSHILFILLITIAVVNSGCPKPCIDASYSFVINSQIKPDLDSLRLTDTLFLISNFSTSLIDQLSGKLIDYSGATDLESTLSIAELTTGTGDPKGSVYEFNYISEYGMIYNNTTIPSPDKVQQLKYQQVGNNYQLRVGLIPQKKGIFALGIGDGVSISRNKSNSCEKASFTFTLANTSQHIYYYHEWIRDFH